MSTSFDERISAFIDGELTEFETRRITGEVLGDSALKEKCQRFMLAGDVIKEELPQGFDSGFADRVMQAIDAEEMESPSTVADTDVPVATWKKPLAGAAIAASVAALALVSLQTITGGGAGAPAALVASSSSLPQSSGVTFELAPAQTAAMIPSMPATGLSLEPRVMTVSSSMGDIAGATLLSNPVVQTEAANDELSRYLTTHSEFASRSGVISRARVLGFTAEPAVVKQVVDQ